ncbi:MAG: hypothetical protein JWM95_3164 [Gemmatimonadetes bacterium]|nr:hypothetical protein [Gemmatimonadota bacterium]
MIDDDVVHPDEGTIHAWLDDALGAAEAADVKAHVASCARCAAAVAEARGLIAGASRVVGMLDEKPVSTVRIAEPSLWRMLRVTPARAAIAAALVVAVGITLTRKHIADEVPAAGPLTAVAPVRQGDEAFSVAPPVAKRDSVLARAVAKRVAKDNPQRTIEAAPGLAIPAAPPSVAGAVAELDTAPARAVARARNLQLQEVVVTSAGSADKVRAKVDVMPAAGAGCYRLEAADGSRLMWQGVVLPLDVSLASSVSSYAAPPPSAASDAAGEARYAVTPLGGGDAIGQWSHGAGDSLAIALKGASPTTVGVLSFTRNLLADVSKERRALTRSAEAPAPVQVVARKISCR